MMFGIEMEIMQDTKRNCVHEVLGGNWGDPIKNVLRSKRKRFSTRIYVICLNYV